jgi:alpha-beta hydrolase superfamily lysophospholipase
MRPLQLTFDVSERIKSGEALSQAAWLFLPERPVLAKAVLLCLAGGTYDKRYWHLEVPGYPGYSFAEHLAGQGYLVVALDHLAVGDSSDPRASGDLSLVLLADGDAAVAERVRAGLREGTLADGVPPLDLPVIGVGHSMGGCLTVMVQARSRPFDAVVLLGFAVHFNTRNQDFTSDDPAVRAAQAETLFRTTYDIGPEVTSWMVDRSIAHPLFHAPDVPAEVIAADDAAVSRMPVRAGVETGIPGYIKEDAAVIDVPVFLAFGTVVDLTTGPYTEPANYGASGDVTLYLVQGSAHCHNFATNRTMLWDRIGRWIPTVAPAVAKTS